MRKQLIYSILSIALLAGLTGCGAGDAQISTNSNDTASPNVSEPAIESSAPLAWDAPTTYSDGSELIPAGYKIHYGTSSGSYTQVIDTATSTTFAITDLNLAPGTYYFIVTVYDSTGLESDISNEVSRTIL